ncbi:MFS transporter [Gordonia sp. NPDC058843]|uniref:MFS transporter n=1 Tax=Gordonia sp. NPDC058843 TaxID=3346648 RepID=UPI003688B7D7
MSATEPTALPGTVQSYLDEVPTWRDGTPATAGAMTSMQKRIWLLASAGKFLEGMIVFMVGVALPLITDEFGLSSTEAGIVTAAPLLGIMIGASALGGLSDRWGRRQMFLAEMVLFTVFLVGVTVSPDFVMLVVCLVGMGLALGCDYPTAHTMISETMPTGLRGRGVLAAFGFQAVGALVGTLVGVIVLGNRDELSDWRWMFGVAVVPAVLVTVGRLFIVQSPHWLLGAGRVDEAEHELKRLLARQPQYPTTVTLTHPDGSASDAATSTGIGALFRRPWRRSTILASIPWFLQDLGTYGIGIFTPTIIAATIGTAAANDSTVSGVVADDLQGAEGAVLIDAFLLIGIVLAILLVNRFGRIRLQIFGFLGCAAGLGIAAASTLLDGTLQVILVFVGFMSFNLMTNLGPNSMTYLLAGEVFPTSLRGTGAGLAASVAKVGAVLTAFLFPILLDAWGTAIIVLLLAGTSMLGAFVTWTFRVETTGLSLEDVDRMHDDAPAPTGATRAPQPDPAGIS